VPNIPFKVRKKILTLESVGPLQCSQEHIVVLPWTAWTHLASSHSISLIPILMLSFDLRHFNHLCYRSCPSLPPWSNHPNIMWRIKTSQVASHSEASRVFEISNTVIVFQISLWSWVISAFISVRALHCESINLTIGQSPVQDVLEFIYKIHPEPCF
jgi:hypothetical protein